MNYEVVNLEKKAIVGLSLITGNEDPEMNQKIGGLWKDFYEKGIHTSVKNRVNDHAIGLYSDYTPGGYTVTVGAEVSSNENSELAIKEIPSGKYAKFKVKGNMVTAVQKSWEEIWNTPLDRSYAGDFEEYLNSDFDNAEIDIYIALKS